MAVYNEILTGRFNRALQKLLSMKGPASMKQLAAEMQPVHPFASGSENRYLEGWERYGFVVVTATPAGGLFAGIRMRNPAGSNIIAVIEKLLIGSSTTAAFIDVDLSAVTLDLATGAVSQRMDPRGRPNSGLVLSQTATLGAVITRTLGALSMNTGESCRDYIVTDTQEITILPGDALTWGPNAATFPGFGAAIWRERLLEESERT